MHGNAIVALRLLGITVFSATLTIMSGCRAGKEDDADAQRSSVEEQAETDAVASASWVEVRSGGGAFSIRIPDGWRVYNVKNRDWVVAVTVEDIKIRRGVPAVVDEEQRPLGDGVFRFSVYTNKFPYKPSHVARITKKGFGPVNGVMGMRYTEDYPTAQTGETAWYVAGERDYYFVFSRRGLNYLAVYRVLPGEANRIMTVEKCVMTMKFGDGIRGK